MIICSECHKNAVPMTKYMNWQPIDTAPKKTPILVTDGEVIVVLERGECEGGGDYPDPVGFYGYDWEFYFEWKDLTHWMPLPSLPKDTQHKLEP